MATKDQSVIRARNTIWVSLVLSGVMMKYTLVDYFHSRRLALLLAIVMLQSAVLTILTAYYRPASFVTTNLGFFSNWWGNTAFFIVILSAVFLGGDIISGEFQNRTGYFTLPNPVRRSSIYVGKWLAAFAFGSLILLIYTAITVGNSIFYFGLNIPYQFGESVLFSWFYLAAVLSVAFLFSTLFKTSAYSILVTAVLLLLAFTLVQSLVESLTQAEPWFLITYGAGIIGDVLQSPYPAHLTTAATLTTYNVTIPEGLIIIGAYLFVASLLGLVLFERKEFN